MIKVFALAAVVAATGGLTQCQQYTQSDIALAINTYCPVATTLQGSGFKLNSTQTRALASLVAFCPPNPPPTGVLNASADIVQAALILQPLVAATIAAKK